MTRGHLAGALGVLVVMALAAGPAGAQEALRTAWGAPDLQGVWDFRTITPMERPRDLADQEFLTEEEAAERGQAAVARNENLANREARRTEVDPSGNVDRGVDGAPGSYNNFWFDRGTSVIATRRTSLVVDPPDGRIPDAGGRRRRRRGRRWPRRGPTPARTSRRRGDGSTTSARTACRCAASPGSTRGRR